MTLNEIIVAHAQWLNNDGGKQADLSGANLRGVDLHGANLRVANIRGADLCGANLRGANLCWSDMCGANLCGANLRWANLVGANLVGANLINTDLCGANLVGAVHEANLAKVNEILGEEELLCQLAEECAELGKAALKLRRVLNGKNKAEANITEEIADVIGVLIRLGVDINGYADIIDKKAQQRVGRLTNLVEVGNGKK